MAPMHKQKIMYDGQPVYRYLLCCKRCTKFEKHDGGYGGFCSEHQKNTTQQTLSCDKFEVYDDTELFLESAARDGEFTKVVVGGDLLYATEEQVAAIYDILLNG